MRSRAIAARVLKEDKAFAARRHLIAGHGAVAFHHQLKLHLTNKSRADLSDDDFRAGLPRFQRENFDANMALVDKLQRIAKDRGVTAAQLALAWVLHQGDSVVPIPGMRTLAHLRDNVGAVDIRLSPDELASIEAAMPADAVAGKRYTEESLDLVDG